MSLYWLTGWEHGVLTTGGTTAPGDETHILSWSDSGPPAGSLVTTPVKNGTYAYRAQGNRYGDYKYISGGASIVVVGCWFRTPNPTVECRPIWVIEYPTGGSTYTAMLGTISGTGEFFVGYDDGTTHRNGSGVTCVADTWYWLEFMVDASASTWNIKYRINGVAQTDYNPAVGLARTFYSIAPGGLLSSTDTTKYHYVDDVLIYTGSAGDYPIGNQQQVIVVTFDQSAAAEHQSITTTEWQYTDDWSNYFNFTGQNETDSRSRLDDLTSADGIRMNAGAAGQAGNARWSLANPSPDPGTVPAGVMGWSYVSEASGGVQNLIVRALLSGNTTDLMNKDIGTEYVKGIVARPGGGSWTNQDIRDLKLEIDSTDSAPNIYVYGVLFEVAYPISTAVHIPRMGFIDHSNPGMA